MKSDFFTELGLYVVPHFLDRETCAKLRTEIRSAAAAAGSIGPTGEVDPDIRRASYHKIDGELHRHVHNAFIRLMPRIAEHFRTDLNGCQRIQFLSYKPGDFYLAHWDRSPHEEENDADFLKERKVSVVVFLNSQKENATDDDFEGGDLTFYGLLAHPRLKNRGFPIDIEEGLLVSFPSTMLHEVKPVTQGERFSVVTWYY